MKLPRPRKLTRGQIFPIMFSQPTDGALRCLAAYRDKSVAAIIRKAMQKAFANDQLYQALYAYFKAIPAWEYAEIKKQLSNTKILPEDRIPEDVMNIIQEFEDVKRS